VTIKKTKAALTRGRAEIASRPAALGYAPRRIDDRYGPAAIRLAARFVRE